MIKEKLTYQNIQKLPLKRIKWMDATDQTFSIKELENMPDNLLTERVSVGWVWKITKDKIILIQDITKDGDVEVSCIPKPWVIL